MTLILGINLTDSVYLAADTRVTQISNGKIVGSHDNLLKIWGNQNGLWCAVAGDAGLAKHLLTELQYQSFSRKGIEVVRENIEKYIYEKADEYWRKKGVSTHATLMFAGNSLRRRARVKKDLVKNLVNAHTDNPEAKNELSGHKFNTYTRIALTTTDEYKTNINATDLFAVQVSDQGVTFTDTEPGQHIAYGSPGLVKEDIEFKEVARIEFGDGSNNPMLLTSYINWMKTKRDLQGVGNAVIPIHIQPDGTSILVTGSTHHLKFTDDDKPMVEEISSISVDEKSGHILRNESGVSHILTPLTLYETHDSDSQGMLEM